MTFNGFRAGYILSTQNKENMWPNKKHYQLSIFSIFKTAAGAHWPKMLP